MIWKILTVILAVSVAVLIAVHSSYAAYEA